MQNSNNPSIGRLLVINNRLQVTRLDQLMDQIGLFRGQAILLVVLAEGDGLTHSEIARALQISPAAATKVIKRLEELHYLQRCPDPSDERISRVFLLEDGRAILAQIHEAFRKINQAILDGFSGEEEQALRAFLQRIHINLQAAQFGQLEQPTINS